MPVLARRSGGRRQLEQASAQDRQRPAGVRSLIDAGGRRPVYLPSRVSTCAHQSMLDLQAAYRSEQ